MGEITAAGAREYNWMQGNLNYKLHDTQKKIRAAVKETKADEILILSSRQLGKSYWGTTYAIEHCIQNPGCIVRVLAPTLKQVSDIVGDNLAPICRDAPPGLIQRHKSDYRWTIGESSLRLGSLERANVDNNRGGNADLIIIEEGCFVGSDDYVYARQQVLAPQLLRSGGRIVDITTIDKDQPDHYILKELLPKAELDGALLQYTIHDNPQIGPDEIAKAMERCGGEASIAWQTEYLNKIVRNVETVIVPHYDDEKHSYQTVLPLEFRAHLVIDWGGTRDMTAALLFIYDFETDQSVWIDERIFPPNTVSEEIVDGVQEMTRGFELNRTIADVPGQILVDMRQKHGFQVTNPIKDDWQAGINNMQLEFTRNRAVVWPRCKFLRQSLKSGRYNKQKNDFERTKALGHCDALAAMMYGLRGMNRENPFSEMMVSPTKRFVRNQPEQPLESVAKSLQPKVFSNDFSKAFKVKRFGTFKK